MIRALSSLCLCVVILAFGGSTALAGKKEKIAILGLEVATQIDADSTRVAQELTVGLRNRPKSGQGPYLWTPGSEKELIDEKLMNSCETEDPKCMAQIGKTLGAEFLVYGKIEKKSLGQQVGYQISLKLLKIGTATVTSNWTDFIPIGEADGTKLQDWARKGYKTLTNENEGGTLLITANVDRGTILINGEERGNITSGKGEVPLTEGRYKVAVVSTGYRRWDSEEQVSIRNGETTKEEVVLKELKDGEKFEFCDPTVSTCENTTTDGPKTGIWKGMMVAGIVVAAGGGALLYYSGSKVDEANEELCLEDFKVAACMPATGAAFTKFADQGTKYEKLSYVAGGLIVVGVGVGVIGLIKGYVATGPKEKQAAGSTTVGRSQRKRSGFAITPVIAPQGAGATLRFDW